MREDQMINENSNEFKIPSLQANKNITHKLNFVHIRAPTLL
jgi:hypothetical protein